MDNESLTLSLLITPCLLLIIADFRKRLSAVISYKLFLTGSFLLVTFASSLAQDFLVLEKTGTKKRYEYYPGDPMTFRIKGEIFRTDEILTFTDSSLVFNGGAVAFKNITRVSLKEHKQWMVGVGSKLIVAGAGYFLIDQFNNSVIQGNKASINDQVVKASLVIVGSGATLLLLSKKRVNTTKNWRLRRVRMY